MSKDLKAYARIKIDGDEFPVETIIRIMQSIPKDATIENIYFDDEDALVVEYRFTVIPEQKGHISITYPPGVRGVTGTSLSTRDEGRYLPE